MSAKRPNTRRPDRLASNEPAYIRDSPPLLAEMPKLLDRNTTSLFGNTEMGEDRALDPGQAPVRRFSG